MATFTMPALGADMETGKVVQWLVKPGDRVRPGDVVAVVETHKGAIDVECFLDGVIDELAPLDQELPVGAVLAQVHGTDEAAATAVESGPARVAATADTAAPAAAGTAERAPAAPTAAALAAPPVSAGPAPVAARTAPAARARASPAARRRAAEIGVAIEALRGSGADGAVVLADVERAAAEPKAARPAAPQAATAPATARPPESARPAAPAAPAARPTPTGFDPAQMRQAIAAAMARSKREIPHYYLTHTIDVAAAQAWLDAANAELEAAERLLPAVMLLKATALALAEVPQLNGFFVDGAFRPGPGIHVGWAIALRGGGLVAPALHDVERQPLPALMRSLRDLVQRARGGRLRSSELTDPTVTVTSVGERGAESVLGVIYPPQVAIVGFGRVVTRPWVADGRIEARPLVTASLAADHRASDGHVGGLLLAAIDRRLQAPQAL